MSTPEELAQLLARCALRDRAAFETLYRCSCAQLFGVVLRIVNDREVAQDVLQEGYVKIWSHAGEFRPERAKPMTWMGSIVRNQAIDTLRRTGSRPQATDSVDDLYWLADENPGPQESVDRRQHGQALHQCLKQLEGDQRRAMRLAYFRGMTHEELAEHMNKPLGTVKSWLRRGLMRLKKCLDGL